MNVLTWFQNSFKSPLAKWPQASRPTFVVETIYVKSFLYGKHPMNVIDIGAVIHKHFYYRNSSVSKSTYPGKHRGLVLRGGRGRAADTPSKLLFLFTEWRTVLVRRSLLVAVNNLFLSLLNAPPQVSSGNLPFRSEFCKQRGCCTELVLRRCWEKRDSKAGVLHMTCNKSGRISGPESPTSCTLPWKSARYFPY